MPVQTTDTVTTAKQAANNVQRYLRHRLLHDRMNDYEHIHGYIHTEQGEPVEISLKVTDLRVLMECVGHHPFGSKALEIILEALSEYGDCLDCMEDDGVLTYFSSDECREVERTVDAYLRELR